MRNWNKTFVNEGQNGSGGTIEGLKKFLSLPKEPLEILSENRRKLVKDKYSTRKNNKNILNLYR